LRRLNVHVKHGDLRTFGRKATASRTTDATPTACHDDRFAFEFLHIFLMKMLGFENLAASIYDSMLQ
jgi:uncharacterized protein (DUF1684 family)